MRILVFATDAPPLAGWPTSGTALRSWGIAQGLRAHGHEVIFSPPLLALAGVRARVERLHPDSELLEQLCALELAAFDRHNQLPLIRKLCPDVVLCGHWPAVTFSSKIEQPLILDLAGPHLLERHYQRTTNHTGAVLAKLSALALADFFIVSGPSQQLYFESFMNRVGVINPRDRTVTITMPLSPDGPPHCPEQQASGYPRLIFAGVFLPWQDPTACLRAAATELQRRNVGSLTIIGGSHPSYPVNDPKTAQLVEALRSHPRVLVLPLLPYDQFALRLGSADVALDLMSRNLERELAVTIRSTTYLWAGVPVVYNDFADLSSMIANYDAGWCIPPDDPAAFLAVLDEVFRSPATVRARRENACRLAREHFAWDRAVAPLLDLLRSPPPCPREFVDSVLDPATGIRALTVQRSAVQRFVSRHPGMCRVGVRVVGALDAPLELSLRAIATGELLAVKQISAGIVLRDWLELECVPQLRSAGQSYELHLRSASSFVVPCCGQSPYPFLQLACDDRRTDYRALVMRVSACSETPRRDSAGGVCSGTALAQQASY